jgi:hypothetical protein
MKFLVELFWLIIAILAGSTAGEFNRHTEGILRKRMFWFFASLAWLYGSPFLYFSAIKIGYFKNVSIDMVKVILTLPMFVSMIFLYRAIKWGK